MRKLPRLLPLVTVFLCVHVGILAQTPRARNKPQAVPPSMIFAVLNDGKLIEPIAAIVDGELQMAENLTSTALAERYKAGKSYSLIFGGKADGSVPVVKSNIGTECGGSSADVRLKPAKPILKGLVMALATNAKVAKAGSGIRRRPTALERTEIESLVRAEFAKEGTSAAALRTLRYHNLIVLDLDNDGIVEFVGSYWVAPTKDERRTLFFIAEKGDGDKYALVHQDYQSLKRDDVMSGDIKDLDTGIEHWLLLDVFDYNGDGTSEIFTIAKGFEGNNYFVYKKTDGKWTKVLENYIYHCAY